MAEFEGKLNLNVETSEIEVNGKFKLTEDELDKVAGGKNEVTPETENTEVEFSVQFDDPVK